MVRRLSNRHKTVKLKLDLHTHCMEATRVPNPTEEAVNEIVDVIRARGLDGIAVTEHDDVTYGYKVRDIVQRCFNDEFLIIPGQEIDEGRVQVVELLLPGGVTFRFLAHPGYPYPGEYPTDSQLENLHGVEIDNRLHVRELDRPAIRAIAEKHNLVMLKNSDAHEVRDIGRFYNEVSIDELVERVLSDGNHVIT